MHSLRCLDYDVFPAIGEPQHRVREFVGACGQLLERVIARGRTGRLVERPGFHVLGLNRRAGNDSTVLIGDVSRYSASGALRKSGAGGQRYANRYLSCGCKEIHPGPVAHASVPLRVISEAGLTDKWRNVSPPESPSQTSPRERLSS